MQQGAQWEQRDRGVLWDTPDQAPWDRDSVTRGGLVVSDRTE